VHDGLDGHLFQNEEQLSQLLVELFCSTSRNTLAVTKQHVMRLQQKRWDEHWNSVVLSVLKMYQ
jgi:hypothetical protein